MLLAKPSLTLCALLLALMAHAAVLCAEEAPPSGKSVSFIPLPDFDTSPNEGETVGVLPVWMIKNERGEVQRIYGPAIDYNELTGPTGIFRMFDYPAEEVEMTIIAAYSQHNNQRYLFEYEDREYKGSRFAISGGVEYEKDGFARFYGSGSNTREAAESNYSRDRLRMEAALGIYIVPNLLVEIREKYLSTEVNAGLVDSVSDTRAAFAGAVGIHGAQSWIQELGIIVDERDSANLTRRGFYAKFSIGFAREIAFGQTDYDRYNLDLRYFQPWGERMVSAIRFSMDYVDADRVPFFELPSQGGKQSLRAFGEDRFTADLSLLLNYEHRILVAKKHLFGIDAEFEVAPFVDVGLVTTDFGQIDGRDVVPVGGIGFRGITRPDVAGRVDVGYGEEGLQVFIGLGYMF